MNEMEVQLRRLFCESDIFSEVLFSGKMLIGKIDKNIRAKVEFVSLNARDNYDALRVTILNRTDGEIDKAVFYFEDMIGIKNGHSPYFWNDLSFKGWYGFKPTGNDYEKISDTVHDYMSMFIDEKINYEMKTM